MVSTLDSPMEIDNETSSGRLALNNRTNIFNDDEVNCLTGTDKKRPGSEDTQKGARKRVKVEDIKQAEAAVSDDEQEFVPVQSRSRYSSMYALRFAAMSSSPRVFSRLPHFSTHSLLRSFVSSNKSDVYKCHSIDANSFMTLPYACEYSHEAKRGGLSLLAVSTEQGTVHILNTAKRRDWDVEPQRTMFQPYANAIFDVQWSHSDTYLATASAGSSIQISTLDATRCDAKTTRVMRGHSGTVKCLAWDPNYDGTMLCSGGRDGAICLWDLRQDSSGPVVTISDAHENTMKVSRPKPRKGKLAPAVPLRSITSLIYSECEPHGIISAGSLDGILRHWDLRLPKKSKSTKTRIQPTHSSPIDPTTYQGTRRARGITSLTPGSGPTAGLLFALGNDSRMHTYYLSSLVPLSGNTTNQEDGEYSYSHPNMRTESFYVRSSLSPCGRWLASGGADNGSVYLFDVSNAGRASGGYDTRGVELKGQKGEVGAVDWASDMVASCADDGTVRVWRPDIDIYRQCQAESEEMKWDWSWSVDPL